MDKILIVDDDDLNRDLLASILAGEYEVIVAENGEMAIDITGQQMPDLILLDIQMPGINGYETCERIKNNDLTVELPIIFVSAKSDENEILKGYEVGGVDYLVKPFNPSELKQKVKLNLEIVKQRKEWEDKLNKASKIDSSALSDAGAYNGFSQFYVDVNKSESYQELANTFVELVKRWGLNCTLQIRDENKQLMFASTTTISLMEEKVIALAAKEGRVVDYGKRAIINGSHCSVLVKNMPCDDQDKYDSLTKYLALLCDGMDGRIDNIKYVQIISKRNEQIKWILLFVLENFRAIQEGNYELRMGGIEIVENMCENLAVIVSEIGKLNDLPEESEKKVLTVGDACLDDTNLLFSKGEEFNEQIKNLIETLERGLSDDHLAEEAVEELLDVLAKVDVYKFKREIKKVRGV